MQKAYLPRQKIVNIFDEPNSQDLINKILDKYQEMLNCYYLEDYEGVLVQVGKFVELCYKLLDFFSRNTVSSGVKFDKIDERLTREISKGNLPSSLFSFLTKSLRLSYKFRNSRDGAHSVDFVANRIDSLFVIENAQWCLAEIVRTFSDIPMEKSLDLINEIMELPTPVIQRFDKKILVLREFSASKEIMIILFYSENNQQDEKELKEMIVDHSSHSLQNVITSLNNLEKKKLLFRDKGICYLTDKGKKQVKQFIQIGGI
ncbi:MAG: hypothetical protein ACXADY_16765 [Candidatus Hodarchaeales archaeon]|jgi:hypothetical protein